MNAGLSNLATLKAHLLGAALASSTEFDAVLAALGLGVAARCEKFCNRKFTRTAGDTHIFYADRTYVVLPRYPVESISAIAQKTSETDGFVALDTGVITQLANADGLVQFSAVLGTYLSQVRITYTGGFFWNQLETTDAGYPTALPSGATAVPADLQLAWLLQCGEVWNKRDKLGLGLVDAPDAQTRAETLKLIPEVEQMLNSHRRFS